MDNFIGLIITVISGVLVYVFSELFTEFYLKPLRSYKELRGSIAKHLVLYADFLSNPQKKGNNVINNEEYEVASKSSRALAAEIAAFAEIKPHFSFTIPAKKTLKSVSAELIGISNRYNTNCDIYDIVSQNNTSIHEIKKALRIKEAKKL